MADSSHPHPAGAQTPGSLTRRRFLVVAGAAGFTGGMAALGAPTAWAASPAAGLLAARRTGKALGTSISMTALHPDRSAAEQALDAAFAELQRVDALMSIYRPESPLSTLNRTGVLEHPHPYLVQVLRRAQEIAGKSAGAFDVTVQPLWELYAAAQKEGKLPAEADARRAARRVDWRKLQVSPQEIRLAEPGMAVTLNGIAQGYAADRVLAALRAHGVRHALVDTGEIGALGRKADGQSWSVGIQHPRVADAYVALARLEGCCMATSGDYATPFSADRAYNHIFEPRTGRSPEFFSSVTVVAPTGTDADALSTAVFVLGREKGLALIEAMPGVEALFVTKGGDVLATKGFPKA